MSGTLRRVYLRTAILIVVLSAFVCGYHLFGRTWLDATYMVVITVATIGFGERSQLSPEEQAYTIVVILVGLTVSAYTLGAFFQLLTRGEIEKALGLRRMIREIDRLDRHVIVCGFGRMGRILCAELQQHRVPFVVVERDSAILAEAIAANYLGYQGNAMDEETLLAVGVRRAKSLVTVLPEDADNVFITLTARNLSSSLQIISRGELPSTQKKLTQAGASRVVLPAAIGAHRIAAMITKPSTVELLEFFTGKSLDVEVNELMLGDECPLVGKTVREAETRRRHGLLIVAVKRADGGMVFNPDAEFEFDIGDTIIVMGKPQDVARFCSENRL